jgi:hypothetical protein
MKKSFSMIVLVMGIVIILFRATGYSQDKTEPVVVNVVSETGSRAGLGDRIIISVANLSKLVADAGKSHKLIVPFINEMMMRGLYPEGIDTGNGTIRFQLHRTEKTREQWIALLGKPSKFIKDVSISVGLEDGYPIATQGDKFELIVIHGGLFYLFAILFVIILFFLYFLATRSEIIRDAGPAPAKGRRAYSLARFQMAFWFFLAIASFLFIWIVTYDLDTVTNSVLSLMGISSLTALGSIAIDKKVSGNATEPFASRNNFFLDVLSDTNGISITRFQMFVWTLVLGIIFVCSVYNNLAMPEFGNTLLILMGISSGTFVGLKTPDLIKKTVDDRIKEKTGSSENPPVG